MEEQEEIQKLTHYTHTLITALSTLSAHQLSHFKHSISLLRHRHNHRLAAVLSSPTLFSLSLHHLHSLSLLQKTHLIAHHLLISLHLLTRLHNTPSPPTSLTHMKLREYDAVLLLLSLCELQQCKPGALQAPHSRWRVELTRHQLESLLSNSGLGFSHLNQYIDLVTRCWRFVGSQIGVCRKVEREVGASPASVVALPAVEVTVRGAECVICKEEMSEGSSACGLPCEHLFHWMCILRWLGKKNTCPVCRFRLPSDDIFGEIARLWSVVVDMSLQNSKRQNV